MTQLIIDGVALPEVSRDQYSCGEELLTKSVEMISGRMVQECSGKVWVATYAYDYMGNALCRQVLAVLRSGRSFTAQVLPDTGDSLITITAICTDLTRPTFAFSRDGVAMWHNLAFSIREVDPHD